MPLSQAKRHAAFISKNRVQVPESAEAEAGSCHRHADQVPKHSKFVQDCLHMLLNNTLHWQALGQLQAISLQTGSGKILQASTSVQLLKISNTTCGSLRKVHLLVLQNSLELHKLQNMNKASNASAAYACNTNAC